MTRAEGTYQRARSVRKAARVTARDHPAAAALVVYVVARVTTVGILLLVLAFERVDPGIEPRDHFYYQLLGHWDTGWYQRLAREGYPDSLPVNAQGGVLPTTWGFYPLVAALSRLAMGMTELPFVVVASTISLLAGVVAAMLIARLLASHLPHGAVLACVAIWAVSPASPILMTAYTEAMAVALVAGFVLALRSERWWMAAACVVLLGLTRPVAAPLLVVVAVAALVHWQHTRRAADLRQLAVVGCAALLAILLWPAVAAVVLHDPNGLARAGSFWRPRGSVLPTEAWFGWIEHWHEMRPSWRLQVVGGVIVAALSLIGGVLCLRSKLLSPELRSWAVIYPAYMIVAQQPYLGFVRYMVLNFPLAILLLGRDDESRARAQLSSPRVWFAILAMLALQILWIWRVWVYHGDNSYIP